jgi:hypothetical protein
MKHERPIEGMMLGSDRASSNSKLMQGCEVLRRSTMNDDQLGAVLLSFDGALDALLERLALSLADVMARSETSSQDKTQRCSHLCLWSRDSVFSEGKLVMWMCDRRGPPCPATTFASATR